jgi:hypothetical protein
MDSDFERYHALVLRRMRDGIEFLDDDQLVFLLRRESRNVKVILDLMRERMVSAARVPGNVIEIKARSFGSRYGNHEKQSDEDSGKRESSNFREGR